MPVSSSERAAVAASVRAEVSSSLDDADTVSMMYRRPDPP
jgi:hypothetical protein